MGRRGHTSEERLHLDAADAASSLVTEDKALDGEDALALDEDLELAVLLTDVVEADALADRGACAGLEGPRAAADGGTVNVVAGRERRNVADGLVGRVVGREVGVRLTCTAGAPHEARGPASVIPTATRARNGGRRVVTSVCVTSQH